MTDFPSLLPHNAPQLQRDIEQVIAGFIADMPTHYIKNAHNPKLCRADFLPFLAWRWSVDDWDTNWTLATQRDVVWTSPSVHRFKGTTGAIKLALASMGYGDAHIHEFRDEPVFDGLAFDTGANFSAPMRWFHYTVTLSQPISAEMAASIHRRLGVVAAERSVLVHVDTSVIANTFDSIAFDAGQTFDAIYKFEEVENVH